MITVNYGTGNTIGKSESPQETGAQVAADWVNYANVQHRYNVKYWEIGNEIYGNDTYDAFWEPDDHCGTIPPGSQPASCGPSVYAQNVKAYIAAMKAVDPTIEVGVVLTAPGGWPNGVTNAGSPQPWDQTVLSALGGSIDFADVRWYPQNPSSVTPPGPTDSGLLADTAQIPTMMSTLRSEFSQYAGKSGIPVVLTETNSVSSNPGKQTAARSTRLPCCRTRPRGSRTALPTSTDRPLRRRHRRPPATTAPRFAAPRVCRDYGVLSSAACGPSTAARCASRPRIRRTPPTTATS